MNIILDSLTIANALKSKLVGKNSKISRVMLNSKDAGEKNACFFAIKGNNYDGNDFIDEAIQNGARLIVTDKVPKRNAPYILVDDTKIALGILSSLNKGKTKIIAITGSTGKTTTKEMLKSVLSQKHTVVASKFNENNEIGVAKTLLSIKNHDFCILEMGMRGLGEIRHLARISEPSISVITNCGSAHLERLKTTENIFKAKTEILEYTKDFAIIPSEPRFKKCDFKSIRPIFVGEGGDYQIQEVLISENGIKAVFKDNNLNRCDDIYINSFGKYNAQNALNVYVVAKLLGLNENDIKNGFCSYEGCDMRGRLFMKNQVTIIEDCYNSSYEGMKNAIESLTEYSNFHNKTPYMLVGDMLEIGDGADEYHYRIGEYAKDLGVKNIFSYGDKTKHILDGFCGGLDFKSEDSLVSYINQNLGEDDVLLVKASRGMHFEKIISKLKV